MMTRFSFSLFLCLLLLACSNNDGVSDIQTGDVTGTVSLFDDGTTPEPNNRGMTVYVEGSLISATTDNDGNFTLEDVPYGIFTLVFSKSGYGVFREFDVIHYKSLTTLTESFSLGRMTQSDVTGLHASIAEDGDVLIKVTTTPDASSEAPNWVRLFFSDQPFMMNLSDRDLITGISDPIEVSETTDEIKLNQLDLSRFGLASGQTAYLRCYADSFYSNAYFDYDFELDAFPNLNYNAPFIVSFIVP